MKTLLTTTAAALLLAPAAFAQGESGESLPGLGEFEASDNAMRASDLIGMRLYATPDELPDPGTPIDAESAGWTDIGEINDLLVGRDDTVVGAVVGTGGFLGLNEREIAVSTDRLHTYEGEAGQRFLVLRATEEELAAAIGAERGEGAGEPARIAGEADVAEEGAAPVDEAALMEEPAPEADAAPQVEVQEPLEEPETMIAQGEEQTGQDSDEFVTRGDLDLADGEADSPVEDTTLDTDAEADDSLVDAEAFAARGSPAATVEDLTGSTVYGLNEEEIGQVNDLVLAEDGSVEFLIIDVGGFLGIGEKPVAVPFDSVEMLPPEEGLGRFRVMLPATADELEAMERWQE